MGARAALVVLSAVGLSSVARAEVSLKFSGKLQSDLRFRVLGARVGSWYGLQELAPGVSFNENLVKFKLQASAGRFRGVADVDVIAVGAPRPGDFGELLDRSKLDPIVIKAHSLFVEATDLLPGLDLRVGQQVVNWGKGDQFNPTNNLNPNDLWDPLLFGQQLGTPMVKADYTFYREWTLSGVLVPIFKPAQLPSSARLGVASLDRLPFVEDSLRWRLHAEQTLVRDILKYPTVVTKAIPVLPEARLDNMQFAFRVAGVLAEHDLAFSYYNGRTDMPQPFVNYTRLNAGRRCNPSDPNDCVAGMIETEVELGYPRMQVLGFNASGQVNALGWLSKRIQPIGYRFELGVFFPQEASIILLQDRMDFGLRLEPAGEYAYGLGGRRPLTVKSTPFAKWTLGLDYSFGRHVYANVQWVHGFVDEFGAGDFFSEGWAVRRGGAAGNAASLMTCALVDPKGERCATEILRPRLGDYLVLGLDFKFLSEQLLVRLFMIWDLIGVYEEKWDAQAKQRVRTHHGTFSAEGFSAVFFPEVTYNFGHGLELSAGGLFKVGKEHTKFGDPAAGGSEVWTRARFTY